MSERDTFFDCVKGIGILLVLLGHTLPAESFLRRVIYSFHMPLFFIVSGFFFKSKLNKTFPEVVKTVLITILIPYVFFLLVWSCCCGWLYRGLFSSDCITNTIISCLKGCPVINTPCWFLYYLAASSIVLWLMCSCFGKIDKHAPLLAIIVSFVLTLIPVALPPSVKIFLPLNFFKLMTPVMFMAIGLTIKVYGIRSSAFYAAPFLVVIMLLSLCAECVIVYFGGSLDINSLVVGKIWLLPTALLGAIACFSFSALVNRFNVMSKPLAYIGLHSLVFFGLDRVLRPWVNKFVGDAGGLALLIVTLALVSPICHKFILNTEKGVEWLMKQMR